MPRQAIEYIAEKLGFRALVGCEIGVRDGAHAVAIMKNINMQQLVLVDPYIEYWDGPTFLDYNEQFRFEKEMRDVLRPYWDKIELVKKQSVDAVRMYQNELFDFVYIDADHSYRSTWTDVTFWWDKVKIGGFLCGHDFDFGSGADVVRVVTEFAENNGRDFIVFGKDKEWCMEKLP